MNKLTFLYDCRRFDPEDEASPVCIRVRLTVTDQAGNTRTSLEALKHLRRFARGGMHWGRASGGCRDLAYSILSDFALRMRFKHVARLVENAHLDFMQEVLAVHTCKHLLLTDAAIVQWLEYRRAGATPLELFDRC